MERRAWGLRNVRSACFSNAGIAARPRARHGNGRLKPRSHVAKVGHERLLEPEIHVHLAVHRRRGGQILPGELWLTDAASELPQAEVAVGDDGPHAVQLGECQRLPVVGGAAFGIEPVGMGCDVAEQMQRMGRKAGLAAERIQPPGRPGATLRRAGRAADRRVPPRGRPSRDGRRFPAPPDARGAAQPLAPGSAPRWPRRSAPAPRRKKRPPREEGRRHPKSEAC